MLEYETSSNYKVIIKRIVYTASGVSTPMLIEGGFNYINIVILANKSLPASALINIMQGLIINTGCSLLGQACTLVSNASGTRNYLKIKKIQLAGGLASLIISVPAVTLALTSKYLFRSLNQPENLLNSIEEYFAAYAPGIPAIFLVHLQKQIALGTSNITPVNVLSFFDNGFIALLGYLLVNGKLSREEMGVAGLGLASSITSWIDLIGFSIYLKYSPRFTRYNFTFFEGYRDVLQELRELLLLGIPSGIQIGSESLIQLAFTSMIGNLGEDSLSAFQISTQYILITIIPTFGLSQTANILGGQANGANRRQLAKNIGNICIGLGTGISLVLSGITIIAAKPLMRPFIDIDDPKNAEMISNTSYLFMINGAAQIFDSMRIISSGAISGIFKNTLASMGIELLTIGGVGLPLSYVFGFNTGLGVIGVCLARGTGISLASLSLFGFWIKRLKGWIHGRSEEVISESTPVLPPTMDSLSDSSFQLEPPQLHNSKEREEENQSSLDTKNISVSTLPLSDDTQREEQTSSRSLIFSRTAGLSRFNARISQDLPHTEQDRSSRRRYCIIL